MTQENKRQSKLYILKSSDSKFNNLILRSTASFIDIKNYINCGYIIGSEFPKIEFEVISKFYCKDCPLEEKSKICIHYDQYSNSFIQELKVNHLPSEIGLWVDYSSMFRYKMMYDIKLKSGDIVYSCYPNGNKFTIFSTNVLNEEVIKKYKRNSFKDSEIESICLSSSKEDGIPFNTKYNIESNYNVFDKWILEVLK